jgi:hypothetical protein
MASYDVASDIWQALVQDPVTHVVTPLPAGGSVVVAIAESDDNYIRVTCTSLTGVVRTYVIQAGRLTSSNPKPTLNPNL